jgi:hypothetical protein
MAKTRNYRTRRITYKGHTIESWSPAPGVYSAAVVDAPEGYVGYNTVYGAASRVKALARVKADVAAEVVRVKAEVAAQSKPRARRAVARPVMVDAGSMMDGGRVVIPAPKPAAVLDLRLTDILAHHLLTAVKMGGSYRWADICHYVEEDMTLDEVRVAERFLGWLNSYDGTFGRGNLATVWDAFLSHEACHV